MCRYFILINKYKWTTWACLNCTLLCEQASLVHRELLQWRMKWSDRGNLASHASAFLSLFLESAAIFGTVMLKISVVLVLVIVELQCSVMARSVRSEWNADEHEDQNTCWGETRRKPPHRFHGGRESDISAYVPPGSCNQTLLCQQVAMTTLSYHNISSHSLLLLLGRAGLSAVRPPACLAYRYAACLLTQLLLILSCAAALLYTMIKSYHQQANIKWNLATPVLIYASDLSE